MFKPFLCAVLLILSTFLCAHFYCIPAPPHAEPCWNHLFQHFYSMLESSIFCLLSSSVSALLFVFLIWCVTWCVGDVMGDVMWCEGDVMVDMSILVLILLNINDMGPYGIFLTTWHLISRHHGEIYTTRSVQSDRTSNASCRFSHFGIHVPFNFYHFNPNFSLPVLLKV